MDVGHNNMIREERNKDILYRVWGADSRDELKRCVEGNIRYAQEMFGERFERLPMYIGDRMQRDPQPNDRFLEALNWTLDDAPEETLFLVWYTFIAFSAKVKEWLENQPLKSLEGFQCWHRDVCVPLCDAYQRGKGLTPSRLVRTLHYQYVLYAGIFRR